MMMLLLWSYHSKEEFGSHQESTFDNIIHKQALFSIQAILQFRFSARDSLQAVWKALLLTVVYGGGPLGFVFSLSQHKHTTSRDGNGKWLMLDIIIKIDARYWVQ